jgi:hypothetical protein
VYGQGQHFFFQELTSWTLERQILEEFRNPEITA